uniref:WAT1-related protein n=1 Tax=Cajanus cajan TaxID=3821 RepID=A0A151QYR6_CAJCA|nr:Auxin-induced protein 5NG4 [Cajanus cajan]
MEAKTKILYEALPFIVMVIMEGWTIGLTIFAKTAISNGMSPFVFIVYTNALATIILFPCSFLSQQEDRKERPPFTFSLFMLFLFLGFTGSTIVLIFATLFFFFFFYVDGFCRITMTQSFLFLGLSYSSPILVCAMGHLIATFNFLLSLILRKTELNLRRPGVQVQVIEFWLLGGVLLVAASFSVSISNLVQKESFKQYPEPVKVLSYSSLVGTILSAIVSCIVERDINAWKLRRSKDLILIVLTAVVGGVIRPNIQIWFTRMKGPLYVSLFKPFGIAFATTFAVSFFSNSLHYGSVIGATVLGVGYYIIMHGEIKGNEEKTGCDESSSDSLDKKIPLLQEHMQV